MNPFILRSIYQEQALRKFSETAKGWYWNMEKLEIMLSELKISGKWQTFAIDCYWYIWNKVQNRKVILLNNDIWNEKEWTGTEHYTY